MATADKMIRCSRCHATSSPESSPSSSSPPAPSVRATPMLRLSSRTSSLYHQGFPADVTAMSCHVGLLASGCSDGSVGLLCTHLAATKAKFAAFTSKHAAAVRQCFILVATAVSSAPSTQRDPVVDSTSAGVEAAIPTACVGCMPGQPLLHASLIDVATLMLILHQVVEWMNA